MPHPSCGQQRRYNPMAMGKEVWGGREGEWRGWEGVSEGIESDMI